MTCKNNADLNHNLRFLQACRCLEMLVGALGDAFEPFVDAYLPALLKNTVMSSFIDVIK